MRLNEILNYLHFIFSSHPVLYKYMYRLCSVSVLNINKQ